MILRLTIVIMALLFLLPAVVMADAPDEQPLITYSNIYTTPYNFEPIAIPTVSPSQRLTVTFGLEQINFVGTVVTSTFALIDEYQILGILLVIMLALGVLRWVVSFVTSRPVRSQNTDLVREIRGYLDLQHQEQDLDE